MTQPIAGWYTDPAGDASKLRYWDGTKWTDSLMDAPAPEAQTTTAPAETTASAQPEASAPAQSTTAYDAAYQQPTSQPAYTESQPTATQPAQAAAQSAQPADPTAQTAQPGGPQATVVSQDTYAPIYVNYADAPLYYVNPQDTTLRLVAFILALISTITMGFAIIPLAWMIPMTVMTWQIYKGKRANTVGFGVCTLIFLNLVSGILLLVSTKEQ